MTRTADQARAYWDGMARRYDRVMLVLGGPIPELVERAARSVAGLRVLEVAAGTGLVTRGLARTASEVVATDYAQQMVAALAARVAQEKLEHVRCEQADLYALRFEPGSFDAAVAANVLHLVPDLDGALAALRRVVKPGGLVIVPTYVHAQTWRSRVISRVLGLAGFPGRRRFDEASLVAAVNRSGLRVTNHEVLPGLLPIAYVEARA